MGVNIAHCLQPFFDETTDKVVRNKRINFFNRLGLRWCQLQFLASVLATFSPLRKVTKNQPTKFQSHTNSYSTSGRVGPHPILRSYTWNVALKTTNIKPLIDSTILLATPPRKTKSFAVVTLCIAVLALLNPPLVQPTFAIPSTFQLYSVLYVHALSTTH